jgi:sigma-B regulation protein RsbU (phosphoserine phosphatase)
MNEVMPPDLDTAPCGFLIFTDNGVITSINQTLLLLLEYAQKTDLVGKSIESIFTMAGRVFYQTHFFPLVKLHGKADEIFFKLKTKNNKDIPVVCNVTRKAFDGSFLNHCIFFPTLQRSQYEQEILLAKKKAEDALLQNEELVKTKAELEQRSSSLDMRLTQLKQNNEDLLQFGKVISHDLQEPIRKISLFADKVAKESAKILDASKISSLVKINKEGQRIRQMVADLEKYLSFNLTSGPMEHIDMDNLVNNVWKDCAYNNKLDNAQLTAEGLPKIDGYSKQLELLFTNIFQNAIDHRVTERPLYINVEVAIIQHNTYQHVKGKYNYTDFAQVTVKDNASGFNPNASPFDISRKNNSLTGQLAFGLAFCKKIVDNHFGHIALTSQPGNGTTVVISLPMSQQINHAS